jgi:itaconyl-CoA hydratase
MAETGAWPAYEEIVHKRYRERFGLWFDELAVGLRFQHRPGLTLSQQDNRDECLDTLNQQMLHFDQQFAKHTEWARCLMDSTLTTKVVMGMTWKTFATRTRLIGFNEITLSAPVFGGDTLYAASEVLGRETREDGTGVVQVRTQGITHAGAVCATLVYHLVVPQHAPDGTAPSTSPRHRSHVEVEPGVYRERMGLFLEDIEAGDTYEHRPGWTCSAERSAADTLRAHDQSGAFAGWHADRHDAAGIAAINPLHVLAAVTGMQTKTFSHIVANLAWENVRFPESARDGDTVYAESTVVEARPSRSRSGQGVVHLRTVAVTDTGRTVCTFDRKVLVYATGHGPFEAAGY